MNRLLVTAACGAVAAHAAVISLTLFSTDNVTTVPGAAVVALTFGAYVNASDVVNTTQLCVLPYVNGLQWGGDACVLRQPSLNSSISYVEGDFTLSLPPRLQNASVCVSVAAQSVPQGPSVWLPPPADAVLSPAVCYTVGATRTTRRAPRSSPSAPRIGLYYEPWFTPLNFYWQGGVMTAEAIPAVGRYSSFIPDVSLQHAYWFMRAGVDVIGTDWTNNLWGKDAWDEREPNVQELCNATQFNYGVWAAAASEMQWQLPTQTLLLGVDNGPVAAMPAIFEEMDFITSAVIQNSTLPGIWENYLGAPLIVLFDGTGANHSGTAHGNYTIRWMASQDQSSGFNNDGYWSWMDGSIELPVTSFNGIAESATSTPAFFASSGWTDPTTAYGHAGGMTWLQEIASLIASTATTPGASWAQISYLWVCQMNEYAGQANGQGYGPQNNVYVDSYSADLSNDIEATSLTACAYRRPGTACGGWGFRYLNLLSAVVDVMGNLAALDSSVVVSILTPTVGGIANYTDSSNSSVTVEWALIGFNSSNPLEWLTEPALPCGIFIDGVLVSSVAAGTTQVTLTLPAALDKRYPHRLSIRTQPSSANGTDNLTLYPLSLDTFDENVPLAAGVPATADVMLWVPESVYN